VTIMKKFFEHIEVLDKLKKTEKPLKTDFENVFEIIKNDQELTCQFYIKNDRGALSNSWLELLDGAGEFAELGTKEASLIAKIKALYLVDCASVKPETVLEIIKKLDAKDAWVQGQLAGALGRMPEETEVKGVPVLLEYLSRREYKIWFFVGEPAAKLMIKLVEKHPKESFEIAKSLLDLWRPGEKEAGVFERNRSKFATHEYKELIFNYYSKVWEKRPFESMSVLVDIYDKYLEECIKDKGYDVSEYLGVSIEDLEDIRRLEYDIDSIVMKAMCEGGQAVIAKEPQKVSDLLENLEKRNKGIFHRVEMYLLRFVLSGTEKDRINKLIRNQTFIKSPLYKYEHRRLLNDKFDEVSDETKKTFIEWVSQQKITDERKKEVEEWCQKNQKELPDFEKWDNQIKAENLYLVREKFKELYEEYKAKSGLNDAALAPRRMVGEGRFVSPMEGTPLEAEVMAKMKVEEILDYILEPKNYEGKKKSGEWREPKDALEATFKEDVKKRALEYLKVDAGKIERLEPEFLASLFYGIFEAVRAGSFSSEGWGTILKLAQIVVGDKKEDVRYRNCFEGILWTLRDGIIEETKGLKFDDETIKTCWKVLIALAEYKGDKIEESEEDPMQRRCRSVVGQAVELTVPLGIVCKRDMSKIFDDFLRSEIRRVYDYVVKDIKRSEVNCTFGNDFARIYWLDKEWVELNTEIIFDDEMWDAVWGTYVSWGRPSPQCFKYLVEKGIYGRAVGRIGKKSKYKFRKEPDEGLVEQLMIGYFNGWIGFEDEVLKQFFENAPAELRGKATRFLTTGFKSVNEEGEAEKEKVAARMREYWNNRLAVIKDKPKENEKEAIELAGWVEDSVLPAKETLELLEQSLDLSGGKIGEMRDARDFVEGVCNLGKGNELLALRCLKKAAEDKNMHMTWSDIQDPLVKFLEDLPENMWSEGKEVADLYGRYNPEKFRGVWEKLRS
jgi:hypothetical protein